MSTPARFSDGQYKNWLNCNISFTIMKEALYEYMNNEVIKLHGDIKQKVSSILSGSSIDNQCGSCSSKDIKRSGGKHGTWSINCKNSICDKWLQEILAVHDDPHNPSINWNNADISKWPTDCYQVAKIFMPKGRDKAIKMPDDLNLPEILSLMKDCSWFRIDLPNKEILSDLIEIRNIHVHASDMRVADSDKDRWIDLMIQLLSDLKISGDAQAELQKLKNSPVEKEQTITALVEQMENGVQRSLQRASVSPMRTPPTGDTDRFMRITYLLVDIGSRVLRQLLSHHTVTSTCTLDQYLAKMKNTFNKHKGVFNKSFMEIMFPPNGNDTNLDDYDITLLSALFNNVVPSLSQQEKDMIQKLRENKNKLYAHAKSCQINASDFEIHWNDISSTLITLSQQCGDAAFVAKMSQEIHLAKISATQAGSYLEQLKAWFDMIDIGDALLNVRSRLQALESKENPSAGSRSKDDEGCVVNEEVSAIWLQKPVVGSMSGKIHQDQHLESQDRVKRRLGTTIKPRVLIPKNPRGNQIIKFSVEDMKECIGEKLNKGGYGTVYIAKMSEELKLECVIKEIKFTDEGLQKSYDREVDSGRILHPFINPIIARADTYPSASKEGVSYLMFPRMINGELRKNIDRENNGEVLRLGLATKESSPQGYNSIIWTRCIYQIAQAIDYLHNPVPSVRGPIFHRDLTSCNIFLDENFNVRIGDFGMAVEAKLRATHLTETSRQGTDGYHPPHRDPHKYNASYDVFSVGIVMLEILTGEKAKLEKLYLYEKYSKTKGSVALNKDLNDRAAENIAAKWISQDHRNKLAKIALKAITLDETKRKDVNLLKELEEHMMSREMELEKDLYNLNIDEEDVKTQLKEYMATVHKPEVKLEELLGSREVIQLQKNYRYQKPVKNDRCVLCCINPAANLSLKGEACGGRKSTCRPFCIPCLTNNHIYPLVCPEHGKTRPPLGDHVYGVFVAGNDIDGRGSDSAQKVAEIFITDVDKIFKVLTAKYPFILGADPKHLKVVKPETPGTATLMDKDIKESFEEIRIMIEKELKKNNLDPERDRLPSSLFIFYFSGHCDKIDGLMLGSKNEKLNATTEWVKEMIHKKLGVDQVLVLLDCCDADSQNFDDTGGLDACKKAEGTRTKASIFQLSSCDKDQKSDYDGQGSYFTSLLFQGLKGFNRKVSENGTVEHCHKCTGPVQYCNYCEEQIKLKLKISGSGDDTVKCCVNCEASKQAVKVPCMEFHDQWTKEQFVTVSSLQKFTQEHYHCLGYSLDTVSSSQRNVDEILLAYYNPDKPCISIHLTCSKKSDNSDQKAYIFSMDCLEQDIDLIKQNIIKYAVEKDVDCDVRTFYQDCGQNIEDSIPLVAIYSRDGKDKDKELTTLDCIYKVWSITRDLEARVRGIIEGLSSTSVKCPVMLRTIKKGMAEISQEDCEKCEDFLRISHDIIQIQVGKIPEALENISKLRESTEINKDFENLLNVLMDTLIELPDLNPDEEGKWLEFRLYENFSVVEIKKA